MKYHQWQKVQPDIGVVDKDEFSEDTAMGEGFFGTAEYCRNMVFARETEDVPRQEVGDAIHEKKQYDRRDKNEYEIAAADSFKYSTKKGFGKAAVHDQENNGFIKLGNMCAVAACPVSKVALQDQTEDHGDNNLAYQSPIHLPKDIFGLKIEKQGHPDGSKQDPDQTRDTGV